MADVTNRANSAYRCVLLGPQSLKIFFNRLSMFKKWKMSCKNLGSDFSREIWPETGQTRLASLSDKKNQLGLHPLDVPSPSYLWFEEQVRWCRGCCYRNRRECSSSWWALTSASDLHTVLWSSPQWWFLLGKRLTLYSSGFSWFQEWRATNI